jgi:hypothetical protein
MIACRPTRRDRGEGTFLHFHDEFAQVKIGLQAEEQ